MTKIKIDQEDCIGCAACTSASDKIKMNDENKASPKELDVANAKEVIDICPVDAIKGE